MLSFQQSWQWTGAFHIVFQSPPVKSVKVEGVVMGINPPAGEAWRVVKHLCPSCTEKFETLEEVRAHWLEQHQGFKAGAGPGTFQGANRPVSVPLNGSQKDVSPIGEPSYWLGHEANKPFLGPQS